MFLQISFFALWSPRHSGKARPVVDLADQTVSLGRKLDRDRRRHSFRRPGAGGDRHPQLSSYPEPRR